MKNLVFAISLSLTAFVSGCSAEKQNVQSKPTTSPSGAKTVVFAGGCFWCVEADFDKVPGVFDTVSGYSGGKTVSPTYKEVTYGNTGHYEVVQVHYDPSVVSFERLVEYYWRHVNPTDDGGQFCDRGDSYRTAIFVENEEERAVAEASKAKLDQSGVLDASIVTPIISFEAFWPAEDYHQDYYIKNPVRYGFYRTRCGRDKEIRETWHREGQ